MPTSINSRAARDTWATLLKKVHFGERHVVTIQDIPVIALVPLTDLERLEGKVTNDQPDTHKTYTEIDAARAVRLLAKRHATGILDECDGNQETAERVILEMLRLVLTGGTP